MYQFLLLVCIGFDVGNIVFQAGSKFVEYSTGPAPAILDWYGHCVRLSMNKLRGAGGMLTQENFEN